MSYHTDIKEIVPTINYFKKIEITLNYVQYFNKQMS